MVCIANTNDGKETLLLMRIIKEFLCGIKVMLADGGYRRELADGVKQIFGYIIRVAMRTDNESGFSQ